MELTKRKQQINWIVKVAIFGAISGLLYYLRFPLPFIFPPFLDVQFSNLPAVLSGFILGPLGGILVLVIKTLIKLPSSSTAFVGELADLVIGLAVVIPSSLYYKYHKTKKGGIIALIIAEICWIVSSILANWLFLIDFYAWFYTAQGGMNMLVGACSSVIPDLNVDNFMGKYLLYAALPFNTMLATVVLTVTFFVYKYLSNIFKKDFFTFETKKEEKE